MSRQNSSTIAEDSAFFVAGGTVPPGSPSYVERRADHELYDALVAGEYCYVLNSRQMGKSSLAVRTVAKLAEAGIRTAFVDLTRIGGANVTADQWYAGLVVETGRVLGLRPQAVAFLRDHGHIGSAQRYFAFLHEIVLPTAASPLVVIVDEIDATRSLPFSTDELFAGIRQLHNGRASEPELRRLTFCLLGAALPGDLIRDVRNTPFNVGRRVELRDFTAPEALPFAHRLGPDGEARLARVIHWTGGHPFLTQALCTELVAEPGRDVDSLVRERYLDELARETDSNLADVGNRLTGRGDPDVGDAERADTLSLYSKLLEAGIQDDESNPNAARIKMSGVARLENGRLTIRNLIYARVFNARWVRDNMPGQELRRQKKAFWRGVLRTATLATVVIALVSTLAAWALRSEHQRTIERDAYRYDRYAATMSNMIELHEANNLMLIQAALDKVRDDPWKGWEWRFWNRLANRQARTIKFDEVIWGGFRVSPDGKKALVFLQTKIQILDLQSGRLLREIPCSFSFGSWLRDSRRFVASDENGTIRLYDGWTGKLTWENKDPNLRLLGVTRFQTTPGDRELLLRTADQRAVKLNVSTQKVEPLPRWKGLYLTGPGAIAGDGSLAVLAYALQRGQFPARLACVNPSTGQVIRSVNIAEQMNAMDLSADGRLAAIGTTKGRVCLVDTRTGKIDDLGIFFPSVIGSLSFSEDGRLLLIGGRVRSSVLVEIEHRGARELRRFSETNLAEFIPASKQFFTVYADARIYNVDDPPETPEFHLPGAGPVLVGANKITSKGEVISSSGSEIRRLPLLSGAAPAVVAKPNTYPADECSVWIQNRFDRLDVLDPVSFKTLREVRTDYTGASNASADGRLFACQVDADNVGIYPISGAAPPVLVPARNGVAWFTFSADDGYLAIAYQDGSVAVYTTKDGRRLWTQELGYPATNFAFSPDGTKLAEVDGNDRGGVFALATGKKLASLVGHSQTVNSISWSPDGKRLATGSDDTTVRLWDPQTGECLGVIGKHDNEVFNVRFLSDGRTLASFSVDGVAKLWMTESRP